MNDVGPEALDRSADDHPPNVTVVLMGVSGSGKSTVMARMVEQPGWGSAEADDFHPAANVAKMAAGHPLTDEDRWPWLRALAAWIDEREAAGENGVATCSALKRVYRDLLRNQPKRGAFAPLGRRRLARRASSA